MLWLVVSTCLSAADGGLEPDVAVKADVAPAPAPAPLAPDDPYAAPLEPVAAPPPVSAEAESAAPSQGFVKGELSMYLGGDRLVVKNTRVGVSAGLDAFVGSAYYLLIEPMVDLRFLDSKLGLGFGVPLRLELLEGSQANPAQRLFRLRAEDWNSFHDFGRLLKYVTYGRKEDQLYISAGQRYATSIGHGAIVRRYAPNIDVDYPRASAEVDYYNDYAGFELHTNDVLEWNTISGIGFIKPLAFFNNKNLFTRSFSLGVSAALDWKAPWELTRDDNGRRLCEPSPGTPCYPPGSGDTRLLATQRAAALIGFDAELKVVRTANIDVKPYVDYSMLVGGDGGLTLGVLARFNLGKETINAFRVVGEFRYLGSRYEPAYFDTFYEIDRFIFTPPSNAAATGYVTKQNYLLTTGLGQRAGYYFEASWGIPNTVGVTLALEGVSNAPDKHLIAHLEVPVLSFLQVFGSYYKRGLVNLSELGSLDEKTIVFAGARLQILPFLFVNGRLYKTFRMTPHLERYNNQLGFVVDLEIGYEFKKSKLPPPPPDVLAPAPDAPAPDAQAPVPDSAPPAPVEPTPAEGTPAGQPGR